MEHERGLTVDQYEALMRPLNRTRVSKRSAGGKQLSYLESWDVKAHLTRIFGFANWDSEMVEYRHVADRAYSKDGKDMLECVYSARQQLVIRDQHGTELARYAEAAVGSASGPANTLGDLHDNALKTAASDALKRCAINLGSQFGLGLYDKGSLAEVIMGTKIKPEGVGDKPVTEEMMEDLQKKLGAQVIEQQEAQQEEPPASEVPGDSGVQKAQREVGAKLERERQERVEHRDNGGPEPTSGPAVDPTAKKVDVRSALAKRMFALLKEKGYDKDQALTLYAEVAGQPVESTKDLTVGQVETLIEMLVKMEDAK